ncbi:MAG: BMP family ABC transporter substrate-binding protein [Candidatus Anammoxibacter sp.]
MILSNCKHYCLAIFISIFIFAFNETGAKELKVGFIYPSPAGDAGWSFAHDQGRQIIDKMPGVSTTFVDSINQGAIVESVLRHMAKNSYDLIFATSYEYIDSIVKVGPAFPEVIFMHCTGSFIQSRNVDPYNGRMYQARYLTGIVAGAMTKSDIIGYVAAHPIAEVVRGINAFTLGVLESNPKARIHVKWSKSWYDPAKVKILPNQLFDMGVDVIAQHQDSPSCQIEAKKRNVYSIGSNHDMSSFAPGAHLTASVWRWGLLYENVVKKVLANEWESENNWWGLEQGLVDIAPFGPMVPEDVRQKTMQRKNDIVSRKFSIFTGPILDQDGTIRIEDGTKATDKVLLSMDWFVKGVIGTPNPE